MSGLTKQRLKELIHYDCNTGVFTSIKSRKKIRVGSEAGCVTRGYRSITLDWTPYRAHRLAWFYMTGGWPKDQIDHINHVRDDNRWINLRVVSSSENNKNRSLAPNNTSGLTGVSWDKSRLKWYAYIKINGKMINLGLKLSLFESACARKSAELKYGFHENHGENYERI